MADLARLGLLVEAAPHRHSVSTSSRSGDVIEPLLSLQWFVKTAPLAAPALAAYREGRVRFVQERWAAPTSIGSRISATGTSRDRFGGDISCPFGIRRTAVKSSPKTRRKRAQSRSATYGTRELTRDPDTLDTWFSSGLWPFSILGWPQSTPELRCWYPSQVLVTGGDIIFLWVARMVMLGYALHGRRAVSAKCSLRRPSSTRKAARCRSRWATSIDPMDLAQNYGADAFRLSILRQMRLESQEIRYHESRCEEARNFNNKIWNATRYMLALPEGLPPAMTLPAQSALTLADRWILTRLRETIVRMSALFDAYDFGNATETIWRFLWYEFCDWYVEATKARRESRDACGRALLCVECRDAAAPSARAVYQRGNLARASSRRREHRDGELARSARGARDPRRPRATSKAIAAAVERLRNQRAEIGLHPRERAVCEVPANLRDDAAALLALYAGADRLDRSGDATESLDEALGSGAAPRLGGAARGALSQGAARTCNPRSTAANASSPMRPLSPRRRPTWLRRSARNSKAIAPSSLAPKRRCAH